MSAANSISDELDDQIHRSRHPHAKHGERRGYLTGCRCTDCRRANADYMREYARKHYDPAKRRQRYETYGRAWYQRQKDGAA